MKNLNEADIKIRDTSNFSSQEKGGMKEFYLKYADEINLAMVLFTMVLFTALLYLESIGVIDKWMVKKIIAIIIALVALQGAAIVKWL